MILLHSKGTDSYMHHRLFRVVLLSSEQLSCPSPLESSKQPLWHLQYEEWQFNSFLNTDHTYVKKPLCCWCPRIPWNCNHITFQAVLQRWTDPAMKIAPAPALSCCFTLRVFREKHAILKNGFWCYTLKQKLKKEHNTNTPFQDAVLWKIQKILLLKGTMKWKSPRRCHGNLLHLSALSDSMPRVEFSRECGSKCCFPGEELNDILCSCVMTVLK